MHKIVNKRSPLMWDIISKHIDFDNKTLLDVGCGECDLLAFASAAGALATGIEIKSSVNQRLYELGLDEVQVIIGDVEDALPAFVEHDLYFDVIFCTSVLPYLYDPDLALWAMSELADVTIIECQYLDDGPPGHSLGILNDDDMADWLDNYWMDVKKIGETVVDIRPAKRSIWMCS